MPVSITARLEKDYLLIKATGIIENLEELKDFSTRLYKEGIKYETRNVLVDEMQMQLTNSVIHQSELINYYTQALPSEIKLYRIAVAVDPKYKELADFWELYGTNRGFHWKGFTCMDDAINWVEQEKD